MALFNIETIVSELRAARRDWREAQGRSLEPGGRELPSKDALGQILALLKGALFPMRLGPPDLHQESEDFYTGHTLDTALHALHKQIGLELGHIARVQGLPAQQVVEQALDLAREFGRSLPEIRRLLDTDVVAAYQGDPAARSVDEVLLCYPGILAMVHHRLAHKLYKLGLPLLARLMAEEAHSLTGIDIHPGATIGPGFFIDHGTGVVIGETAVIGERVRLYQAVTLGAKRFAVDDNGNLRKGEPRHPIVEDDVVIYAGATVLGRVTVGCGSTIGGNVWLTHDVRPGSHITQAVSRNEALAEALP